MNEYHASLLKKYTDLTFQFEQEIYSAVMFSASVAESKSRMSEICKKYSGGKDVYPTFCRIIKRIDRMSKTPEKSSILDLNQDTFYQKLARFRKASRGGLFSVFENRELRVFDCNDFLDGFLKSFQDRKASFQYINRYTGEKGTFTFGQELVDWLDDRMDEITCRLESGELTTPDKKLEKLLRNCPSPVFRDVCITIGMDRQMYDYAQFCRKQTVAEEIASLKR